MWYKPPIYELWEGGLSTNNTKCKEEQPLLLCALLVDTIVSHYAEDGESLSRRSGVSKASPKERASGVYDVGAPSVATTNNAVPSTDCSLRSPVEELGSSTWLL